MTKLQVIMQFALENGGTFSSKDANRLIGHTYYCNGAHHVCAMLGRAVKSGTIERVSKGVFRLKHVPLTGKIAVHHPNQKTLL